MSSSATRPRRSEQRPAGAEPRSGRSELTAARWQARRRRLAVAVLLGVFVAAILAFPARSYLDERGELAVARGELDELSRENATLAERRDRLDDPAEIARIARRDLGLVEPGEESYTMLPPATAGLNLPRAWPFDRLSGAVERHATAGG